MAFVRMMLLATAALSVHASALLSGSIDVILDNHDSSYRLVLSGKGISMQADVFDSPPGPFLVTCTPDCDFTALVQSGFSQTGSASIDGVFSANFTFSLVERTPGDFTGFLELYQSAVSMQIIGSVPIETFLVSIEDIATGLQFTERVYHFSSTPEPEFGFVAGLLAVMVFALQRALQRINE